MPIPSLPVEIRELMTVEVTWEKSLGKDGYGQHIYDNPVTLKCWWEAHSTGGVEARRDERGTMIEPQYDLYFTGDDPRVRGMAVADRFTVPAIDASNRPLQAIRVATFAGPPFDNSNPWMVVVSL